MTQWTHAARSRRSTALSLMLRQGLHSDHLDPFRRSLARLPPVRKHPPLSRTLPPHWLLADADKLPPTSIAESARLYGMDLPSFGSEGGLMCRHSIMARNADNTELS